MKPNPSKIIRLGVTGGMGCGKSGLMKYLGDRYPKTIHTVDLDQIAFRNYKLNKWSLQNMR